MHRPPFPAGIKLPTRMILLPLFTVYFQTGLTGTLWPLRITYTATGLPSFSGTTC